MKIAWDLDRRKLSWPSEDDMEDGSELGMNRHYQDPRGSTIDHVTSTLDAEDRFLTALEKTGDYEEAMIGWEDEFEVSLDRLLELGPTQNLDPGVASCVCALSVLGCIPFTSCNGGEYGGFHAGDHPHVAFFAKDEQLDRVLPIAQDAGVGLANDNADFGAVVIYAMQCEPLRAFARGVVKKLSNTPDIVA